MNGSAHYGNQAPAAGRAKDEQGATDPERIKTMTMVYCETEMTRTALRAPAPAALAKAAAGNLAKRMNRLAQTLAHTLVQTLADRRRARRNAAALAAMPDDLRKDLGWPAGDMHR